MKKKYDEEKIEVSYNQLIPLFARLYQSGCRAIAETSPQEYGQNLKLMQRLSKASGIKLIPNTGMIYRNYEEGLEKEGGVEGLSQRWIKDFKEGLDTLNGVVIRPSHIKLFISNGSIPEVEKKILKAAVIASNETGMPIHCHIIEAKTAEEVMNLLNEYNCDFSKLLWAHAGHEGRKETIERAIEKGMWLGFDSVQIKKYETYYTLLREAIKRGYEDRVLLSQDYDFYEQITENGDNNPCCTIFTDFILYCEEKGLSREVILKILTQNPASYFDIETK